MFPPLYYTCLTGCACMSGTNYILERKGGKTPTECDDHDKYVIWCSGSAQVVICESDL